MARTIRIVLLLLVLATVAQQAWLARSRALAWVDPLRVTLYPLNADGSPATAHYLARLDKEIYLPIEDYFVEESKRHGLDLHRPLRLTLAPPIVTLPPPPPSHGKALDIIVWSLKMRLWAWRHTTDGPDRPQIRLFIQYYDPAQRRSLPHSIGLERGMIGLINAFATPTMNDANNVIIAHELLHTLGATDKYDPASNQPRFPEGYADPTSEPRLPQTHAEIMGGRIPVTPDRAEIPENLQATLIGKLTATEIGWSKSQAPHPDKAVP